MNAKLFFDAWGEADGGYVSARPARKEPAQARRRAIAICLCLIVAFSAIILWQEERETQSPLEGYLNALGLEGTVVQAPVLAAAGELPRVTEEELIASIRGQLTVQGEITALESAVIRDDDATWYLTTMTLSVEQVIGGRAADDTLRVACGAVYTGQPQEDAIPAPGLAGCQVGMHGVFVLTALDGTSWEIAGEEICLLDLGEYRVAYRLDREDDRLTFTEQNISVDLDALTLTDSRSGG